jgi:hypothetical protein
MNTISSFPQNGNPLFFEQVIVHGFLLALARGGWQVRRDLGDPPSVGWLPKDKRDEGIHPTRGKGKGSKNTVPKTTTIGYRLFFADKTRIARLGHGRVKGGLLKGSK